MTKFYYGENGELLAEDENGNVSEIVTMGNYCVPDDELPAQKKRIKKLSKKAKNLLNR
ncbi:MAG: hypothetical protein ACFNX0_00310 [Treponema sp.]